MIFLLRIILVISGITAALIFYDGSSFAESPGSAESTLSPNSKPGISSNRVGQCDGVSDTDRDAHADVAKSEDTQTTDVASESDSQANSGCDDDDDSSAKDSPGDSPPAPPAFTSGADFYDDSQRNVVWSYRTLETLPLDGNVLVYRKDAVQARDAQGYQALAATSFSIHRDLSENFGLSGGFGAVHNLVWNDPVGSFESDFNYGDSSAVARISRDMLSATAQEIRANIRQTDFSISLSRDWNDHLSSDAEFHQTLYSDGNRSNDVEFSPRYTIPFDNNKLVFGYQFQDSAFGSNPDNGYWAPKNLLSNSGSLKWMFEGARLFASLQLSAGDQMVAEFAEKSNRTQENLGGGSGFDASIAAVAGIRLNQSSSIEYYLSHDSSVGFSSNQAGFLISCPF
jgi:hypothetical protein